MNIGGIGYGYSVPGGLYGSYAGGVQGAQTVGAQLGQDGQSAQSGRIGGVQDSRVKGKTADGIQGTKQTECQTCKARKYQDGSDEMVSYKAATHISPGAAGSAVRAHEQEHVSNAYKKAAQGGGKVLQASVQIHMEVCPECGRSYVAGGTTSTRISYPKDTQYGKDGKSFRAADQRGANFDVAV